MMTTLTMTQKTILNLAVAPNQDQDIDLPQRGRKDERWQL